MAEPSQLEQIAKNASQQEKKEEKPISPLRSFVAETGDLTSKVLNAGIAISLPYGADKFMGGLGARATSGAFYLASDDKSSKSARQESMVGAAFAAFAHYTMQAISAASAYARAALVLPWQAAANAYYMTTDHLVKEKSFRGLGKKFKEHYMPALKKVIKWLAIPTFFTTYLPVPWQVPSIAAQSFVFRKYIMPSKKEPKEEKDKTTYRAATSNVIKRLGSKLVSPLKAVYEIGSNLYRPKQPPAAQPA